MHNTGINKNHYSNVALKTFIIQYFLLTTMNTCSVYLFISQIGVWVNTSATQLVTIFWSVSLLWISLHLDFQVSKTISMWFISECLEHWWEYHGWIALHKNVFSWRLRINRYYWLGKRHFRNNIFNSCNGVFQWLCKLTDCWRSSWIDELLSSFRVSDIRLGNGRHGWFRKEI